MKRKLINLVAVLTLALVVIGALGGCKTNSSGWPIIWGLNNGTPVPAYSKAELQRNARLELNNALNYRDDHISDLVEVGKSLVTQFGADLAWSTVLDCWRDLTNGQPVDKASDVIWLQDKGAHVQSLGWLIANRTQWK